jgi:TatD DNase family protein
MKEMQGRLCGGVIHCFSYSTEIAREYIKMGYYIGVGGVVTFNNGRKLKEVVEAIPLTSIVLETDSPYLSPVPFRGKRNSALNIPYVAKEIAALKGVTEEEVYDVTFKNSLKLYRMEDKTWRN